MKLLKINLIAFLLLIVASITIPATSKAQYGSITFQTFYDELYPYGQWISDPQYGYVWRPDVSYNFRPYYTNGHWAMTEYGNTWVSNYDWGWAPFHYGRWNYDSYYGWVWVPDYQWGPAWVSWRSGGGYYGWAPMTPGLSINVSFGYNFPMDWWIFIPYKYIYYNSYNNYYRGPRYNNYIYSRTNIIRNTYRHNSYNYICGPSRKDVRRYSGRPVNIYKIQEVNRPRETRIAGNRMNIYRPEVTRGNNNNIAPRTALATGRRLGTPESISSNNGRPSFSPNESEGVRRITPGNNTNRDFDRASTEQSYRQNAQPQQRPEQRAQMQREPQQQQLEREQTQRQQAQQQDIQRAQMQRQVQQQQLQREQAQQQDMQREQMQRQVQQQQLQREQMQRQQAAQQDRQRQQMQRQVQQQQLQREQMQRQQAAQQQQLQREQAQQQQRQQQIQRQQAQQQQIQRQQAQQQQRQQQVQRQQIQRSQPAQRSQQVERSSQRSSGGRNFSIGR